MENTSIISHSMASTEDIRKNALKAGGRDIIKSPYNKVNVKNIKFKSKPKKKRREGLPDEKVVSSFLKQLTFRKLSKLHRILNTGMYHKIKLI